jgi:hypothetical protein
MYFEFEIKKGGFKKNIYIFQILVRDIIKERNLATNENGF